MHLEYVRIHGTYRVHQAEYVIYILVVAPDNYVNIYSTPRTAGREGMLPGKGAAVSRARR